MERALGNEIEYDLVVAKLLDDDKWQWISP